MSDTQGDGRDRPRITARFTLEYKGERIAIEESFPSLNDTFEEDCEGIDFLLTDGNYACDCNRSLLARQHGANWPELECGNDQIEIVGPIDFIDAIALNRSSK